MNQDWILQTKETRRTFSSATWVPLRASRNDEQGEVRDIGYRCDLFACGSVAFPPEHREFAERLGWSNIGIGHSAQPCAYKDGYYVSIEQYQYHDKEPIGVQLVFEHPQPVATYRARKTRPDAARPYRVASRLLILFAIMYSICCLSLYQRFGSAPSAIPVDCEIVAAFCAGGFVLWHILRPVRSSISDAERRHAIM